MSVPELGLPLALVAAGTGHAVLARSPGRAGLIGGGRVTAFVIGIAVLAVALVSPLDGAAGRSLAWHMAQHLLLVSVAAPLLALGRPFAVLTGRRSRQTGTRTSTVAAAALASVVVLLAWHVPALYDAALRDEAMHAVEHLSLLGTAFAVWALLLDRRRVGTAVLWVFAMSLPMTVFGLALTIARTPWYAPYVRGDVGGALRDQQLAGVVMWAAGGAASLAVAVACFAWWLARSDATPTVSVEAVR